MSLRSFHLVVLAAALVVSLWLCAWAVQRWAGGEGGSALVIAAGATLAAAAIGAQGWWALAGGRGERR